MERRFFAVLCVVAALGCGKGKDEPAESPGNGNGAGGGSGGSDDQAEGSHYGKILVHSTDLSLRADVAAPENCGFSLDVYRGEGTCFTPLAVSGFATKVDLGADVAGRGPTRLLSKAEEDAEEGAILVGDEFDLSSAGSTLVGNNTLWHEYESQPSYSGVAIDFAYTRYQFAIKDSFVTLLIPAYPQPFAQAARSLCGFSDSVAEQSRYSDVDLLPEMAFERGDLLFCVKDASDEPCEPSDYKWLDLDSSELVEARPSNPKRSAYLSGTAIECENSGDDRYGFNFKFSGLYANIPVAERFKLYGDFSYGELSKQWASETTPMGSGVPSSPYVIYYHEDADGRKVTGTELVATLDFDVANSAFVEGLRLTDIESSSLGAVLAALEIKSQWAFDKKFGDSIDGGFPSHYAGMSVSVGLELTGDTDPPRPVEDL